VQLCRAHDINQSFTERNTQIATTFMPIPGAKTPSFAPISAAKQSISRRAAA
jgi:hypothetical protein